MVGSLCIHKSCLVFKTAFLFGENMIFYTADLHFGYAKILETACRPFSSVREMDEALIENWNQTVCEEDTVYVVGDVGSYSTPFPGAQLSRLRGHKHLIRGNHDSCMEDQRPFLDHFESVTDYLEIDDGDAHILLCHHPLVYIQRSFVIHGHTHNTKLETYQILQQLPRVLNAGVDVNGFKPVTLQQLIENNRFFYQDLHRGEPRHSNRQPSGVGKWGAEFHPLPQNRK